jgi:hypothetical protein
VNVMPDQLVATNAVWKLTWGSEDDESQRCLPAFQNKLECFLSLITKWLASFKSSLILKNYLQRTQILQVN